MTRMVTCWWCCRIKENLPLNMVKCAAYLFGKGHKFPTEATMKMTLPEKWDELLKGKLEPGQGTAMDQCEVRVQGHLLKSAGETPQH